MSASGPARRPSESRYLLDVEDGAEMARLIDQDKVMTETMNGLFAEQSDLSTIFDVLDLGCGPGSWVCDVARTYPEMEVTGVDISKSMTEYAQAFAQIQELTNAHFLVMNVTKPLAFEDEAFDLVNLRLGCGYIQPEAWPSLLAECMRVLKPGGIMRWTEAEWGAVNTPAMETMCAKIALLLPKTHMGFSPTGRSVSMTHMMHRFLRKAGFQEAKSVAYVADASYGESAYAGTYQDFDMLFKSLLPVMVQMRIATQEELETLCEDALAEMHTEDFCMDMFIRTSWGIKPSA